MEGEKNDTSSHDVGFKIFCSFGNGYRLTFDPAYRDVVIAGARSLATRYSPIVGCTRSWNNRHFPVIIDNMMNLEILFWAARHGGDPAWYDMAVSHALKTRQNHVRADGSTYQLVDYDPNTGAVLGKETVQGYSTESTWARGQAWAVYGFTMTYREAGDTRFLDTARQVADYFIDHLPADHVPYRDFEAPNIPNEKKDSSAAAIAASGLLELSTLVTDGASRTRYREASFQILESLCSPAYLAEGTTSSGILLHGVGNKPSGSGCFPDLRRLLLHRGAAALRDARHRRGACSRGLPPGAAPPESVRFRDARRLPGSAGLPRGGEHRRRPGRGNPHSRSR